ncbi:helix-turn-helix domain-containing protein [Komagataeibacter intermedius]|uniref:helix-turn-helix domain-containing protein n=1 Tax=Komagataeibacter intermedius TaxID=66229 RepID=UPI003B43CC00
MADKNNDLIPIADAIAELNQQRAADGDGAGFHAMPTVYAYAASGRIPTIKRGRFRFVRRSDLPAIAARLPVGRTGCATSHAMA